MGEPDGRRRLPPVDAILNNDLLTDALRARGRIAVRRAVRTVTDEMRRSLKVGMPVAVEPASVAKRALELLQRDRRWLRPVINATGVLLHTGLGRAPMAREAIEAVAEVAGGYCNLELDLGDGARGAADVRRGGLAPRADRRGGRHGRQQQRRRHRARLAGSGGRAGGHRLARAARGDRRQLPPARDLRGLRGQPARGRHDQQDPAGGLSTRHRPGDRRDPPRASQQLPDRRVHRSRRPCPSSSSSPMPMGSGRSTTSAPGRWGRAVRPGSVDEPTAAEGLAAGADLVLFSGDKLLGGPAVRDHVRGVVRRSGGSRSTR